MCMNSATDLCEEVLFILLLVGTGLFEQIHFNKTVVNINILY